MNFTHPNLARAVGLLIAMMSLCAAGCRNTQTGIAANPFMAPNRVPPPATRALLPGQAQPYYPGDPLPVMQSNAAPPATSGQVAAASEPEMPSATEHLSWTSPSGPAAAQAVNLAAPVAAAPQPSAPPTATAIAANEPSIAIPDDSNALRFALPAAAPVEPGPFVPTGPVGLASHSQSIPQPTQMQPPQPAAAIAVAPQPATQAVQQATYTEPVIPTTPVEPTSPWRSPQIAAASLPSPADPNFGDAPALPSPPVAQPMASAPVAPPLIASQPMVVANTMDVRLRAVPSPPVTAASTMPRIRIPGTETAPMLVGSNDGFRPRGTMR